MNFDLSDEQKALQEAASNALSRQDTIAAAREALDGAELPDMWPTAREAGWPGLLIAEDRGGAGLDALDAALVAAECGRRLASVGLLGHVPASAVVDAATAAGADLGELPQRLAEGEARAALVPARPPSDLEDAWTVEAEHGSATPPAPVVDGGKVSGTVAWVPDAPGADVLVVAATDPDGSPCGVVVEGDASGVEIEDVTRYDATHPLGHVRLDGAPAQVLEGVGATELAGAWYLAQVLLGAESLGAVEAAMAMAVEYAKERYAFGRAIGSYQAIKHQLTEVLRQLEAARSLLYYAGWASNNAPEEFALAASAARLAGSKALDYASRANISVHGGIGATWEHDAPLFFRRAQVSRRLLGGSGDAADRVAGELLATAAA